MNHTFTPLTIGSTGIGVNKMQAYLNMFQERGLITTKVNQDGDFGAITANAVREFQAYSRLPINGKIDDATWSAIVNKLRELRIITNIPVASRSFFLAKGSQGLEVFKMQEYLNEMLLKTAACVLYQWTVCLVSKQLLRFPCFNIYMISPLTLLSAKQRGTLSSIPAMVSKPVFPPVFLHIHTKSIHK